MIECGWRTVVVDSRADLSLSDECLRIAGADEKQIPLDQIGTLLIHSQQATVTTALISALIEKGIRVVFCNRKHHPAGELQDYGTHTFSAGRIREQADWDDEKKDRLWEEIVRRKIRMQQKVLERFSPDSQGALFPYEERLLPGDPGNCEGQAAKVYFHRLFGYSFSREKENDVNAALNYGYAILLSAFNRAVTLYGYHPSLGIHHRSCVNPYNLGCDLMEPFRPFVDAIVRENGEREFDAAYRDLLIRLLYMPVRYGRAIYEMQDGVCLFTEDCLRFLQGKGEPVGEVGLAG